MKRPCLFALGLLTATANAAAQGRVVRPPQPAGPIAVTLPAPPPQAPPRYDTFRRERDVQVGWRGLWNVPYVVTSPQVVQTVPSTYAVPYYYPVPVARRVREPEPRPAPVPYDPSRSRMVVIGSGADGGGGVLRWQRLGGDSVRVTWLGAARAVSSAKLVIADSLQTELVARGADALKPVVLIARPAAQAVYVGVAVTFADGAMHTTLVPLTPR